jgi:hypothetical protein
MILAFADDSTVEVFNSTEQANGWLELIDVENREYTFLDERGFRLEPVFDPPIKKRWLWFFVVIDSGPFTFQPTEERRDDLLQRLQNGEVKIGRSPAKVCSLDELRSAAPALFHS